MSAIMFVMMVVMLVAIFSSDHKGMMSGHSAVANTDQARSCDQSGQTLSVKVRPA